MKLCLLITFALDTFIKEKNNTLYLPWISPLSFFHAKGVYLVKLNGKVNLVKKAVLHILLIMADYVKSAL